MARAASPAGLTIGHLQLAGGSGTARDRLVSALDQISLAAIGMPPRATLVLGRFAAPRALLPERPADDFVRPIEAGLRDRAFAARHGRSGGEDFYFEDQDAVELALIEQLLAPQGPRAGWIALIPGGIDPVTRWRRTIFSDPARSARLIVRLVEAGRAEDWLMRFDDIELIAAERIILTAQGLTAPQTPTAPASPLPHPDTAKAAAIALTIRRSCPEWSAVTNTPAIRRLTLIALIAERRPSLLSAVDFPAALSLLLAPAVSDTAAAAEKSLHPLPIPNNVQDRNAAPSQVPSARQRPKPQPARGAESSADPAHHPIDVPAAARPPASPAQETQTGVIPIETRFGGLFFLLNIFIALNLWGDFTRPRDGLPGLSPFELIGMLGRRWYGRSFTDDPIEGVWRSLAGLAPGERPGLHFDAPLWSVPDAWLTPWPDTPARRRGRTMWHAAGFPLRDSAAARTAAGRRRRWVIALARYLDARLAMALPTEGPESARNIACRRPARLVMEGERLSVHFTLEDHPIALRLAGLDRDPGRLGGTATSVHLEFDI